MDCLRAAMLTLSFPGTRRWRRSAIPCSIPDAVHRIRTTSAGNSLLLRQCICSNLEDCSSGAGDSRRRECADQGEFALNPQPPALTHMGSIIWKSQKEWSASASFVDHHVIAQDGQEPTHRSDQLVAARLSPPNAGTSCRRKQNWWAQMAAT
jgi:hypothetical protein